MAYTHEYSNYPEEVIRLKHYKNVDDSIGSLVNQIETYRKNGDYEAALKLIETYYDQLSQYNISMTTINALIEEIRNTQVKALEAGQFLSLSSEEPEDVEHGFVWLGGD